MDELSIMVIVSVIEVGKLRDFNLEELSELWSSLSVCIDDECFFATFNPKQQSAIKKALKDVEKELSRRGAKPVNLFQMMQDDPNQAEFYLRQFSSAELFDLADNLKEFNNSQLVSDLLKLVNRQIYQRVPMA